ncbi:MAG: tripartite tricarboxylate transporter substrate binding protein [Burkholderiales bacterium]|nr:MAG: tripartite tricarboxylate transporter substrate binding protein [Burkholderiales bacterium]
MIPRRQFLSLCGAAAASSVAFAAHAQAGAYPTQPVRMVVPYPPGGGSDFLARTLSPAMAQALGQPVYVENRPGGGGTVGAAAVTRTFPADGYTVLLSDSNPLLTLSYDPLPDLVPVTLAGTFDFVLVVNPQVLGARTVQDIVAAAKSATTGLDYAAPGVGTTHHMAMELFARDTGARLVAISYKGGAPALQDLLAGQVALMFLDRASARQYIDTGKLRAIGAAGGRRIASYPALPTIAEQGVPHFAVDGWLGLSVRKGTPAAAVQALQKAYQQAIADPAVRARMVEAGINPAGGSAQQFAAYRDGYMGKWKKLIADRGLKPE